MRLKKNEIILQQLKGRTKILDLFENGKVYRSKKILIRLKKEEKLPFLADQIIFQNYSSSTFYNFYFAR